ncbi:serpentine type 7TM GPCR chemoreceptor str domain-containing protein [Ditylenchus destructor]|nr:serpentine type 7TM GPCR chemoreceptor str domain-containing protein [Ditylenchus destructor]
MAFLLFLGSMIICAQHYCYIYRCVVVAFSADVDVINRFNKPLSKLLGMLVSSFICALVGFATFSITMDYEEIPRLKLPQETVPHETWWCVDIAAHPTWAYFIAAFFIASQLVNLFGGIAIIRAIKLAKDRLSPATYKMQMQLTKVLLVQGVSPFFCIFLPIVYLTVVQPFLRDLMIPLEIIDEPNLLDANKIFLFTILKACLVLIALFPFINALLNIIFIKPYREFTVQLFRVAFCRRRRLMIAPIQEVTPTISLTRELIPNAQEAPGAIAR